MNLKRVFGLCLVLLLTVLTSACFTIEKEIFLNADGSGELVFRLSMPDLPEKAKTAPGVPQKNPAEEIGKLQKEVLTKLPPTLKLKAAKQIKQNGLISFYAVLEFKDLKDTDAIFANLGQSDLNEIAASSASQWEVKLEKQDGKSVYTETILMDTDKADAANAAAKATTQTEAKPTTQTAVKKTPQKTLPPKSGGASGRRRGGVKQTPEPPPTVGSANPAETPDGAKDFEEQLKPLFLALINLRFVLHAPAPISESNADMLLNNNRIAVWNCSLVKFASEKKPIAMKAIF
ncbi:MAG: hypothetical protein HY231_13325 [Acidobacteria bacterium]|nr:hypothetical protein [Acidobacteriota bacterium]